MNQDSRALTIVTVDDEADQLSLTRRLLRKEGIVNNVISERDPNNLFNCLDMLMDSGGDRRRIMILLDLNMPDIDGFAMLKRIRQSNRYRDTTVIMLSGSDDEDDMMEAFDLGANGYVVKPLRGDELFAALTNVGKIRYQLVQ
jgi:two-component system, response regulator